MEEILLLVGHRSGGRAAEFLLKRLAMSVSDDTILRRIKRVARAARHGEQRLRVVGVDDWAWKKGQTYGTILVDLERRTVADLLPHRSAEQLAEWLKQHPEVEVITRGDQRRDLSGETVHPINPGTVCFKNLREDELDGIFRDGRRIARMRSLVMSFRGILPPLADTRSGRGESLLLP